MKETTKYSNGMTAKTIKQWKRFYSEEQIQYLICIGTLKEVK